MRICTLTLAKNEDEHIEEFLDHYFNVVGVDHIFWIDNNTPPLQPVEIDDNRVTIIRRNDVYMLDGKKKPQEYQNEVINDVIKNNIYGHYDWCMYVDVDELLEVSGGGEIHDYVNGLPEGVDYVPLRWIVHGNNYYIYDSELPYKTMRENYGWDNNYVDNNEYKPFFKVYENSAIDMYHCVNEGIYRDFLDGFNQIHIDWDIKIHHYRLQSIEHYIRHKIINGWYKYSGDTKKEHWISGLFSSLQFYDSNPKILYTQYPKVLQLLKEYNISISQDDINYLEKLCNPNLKVCVLTCAKNEDEHIEEFVDHYLNEIHVDHIFWIDNNTPPLKPVEINNEHVTIIRKNDVNWDDGKKNPLDHQNELLTGVLRETIYNNYDWCVYVDVDELLDLNGEDVHNYINRLPPEVDFVPVRWVLHSNNYYIYDSELPYNTMKENYGWDDNYITWREFKAIFKVHENSYIDIYYPYNKKVVDKFIGNHEKIWFDESIRVHHYRLQTLEHYIRHKVKNGLYGMKNTPTYVTGLFNSAQFKNSYPKLKHNQYDQLMGLLKAYNIELSESDDTYLKKCFKIN